MFDVEVTIIVETFNLGEGSFQPTLRRTLVAANRIAAERDGTWRSHGMRFLAAR